MSSCRAPAGSPCRTGKSKVAIGYHTARFRLVPSLAKSLTIDTPALRKPGKAWTELPRPAAAATEPGGHVRIGYARASTVRQSLDTQLDSLRAAGVTRVFAEKISTRATTRPELDNALALAREIRASGVAVTLVVHEHKRLGRGIELAALAEQLKASDIGLVFLSGELQGSHDPSGVVFTVLAALSGMEREYIRDRTLEGHESARARGKTIGGATVTDEDMLSMALHLRQRNHSLRDIAARLVITTGKKKGRHPSPATVLRLLRDHDQATEHAGGGSPAAADTMVVPGVRTPLPVDRRDPTPDLRRYDQLLTRTPSAKPPEPEHTATQPDTPAEPVQRPRASAPESARAWAARVTRWRTAPGPVSELVSLTRDPELGEWTVTDHDGTHLGALAREVRVGGGRGRWKARDRHGARLTGRGPWATRDDALVGLLGYYIDRQTVRT